MLRRIFFAVSSSDGSTGVLPMFKDSWLKANWAVALNQNLHRFIVNYPDFGVRRTVMEAKGGDSFRQVIYDTNPAPELPLMVGDIIGNLRAALDHQVSAVYREKDKRENDAYWPFGEDRSNLKSKIDQTLIKHGLERLAPFFLDEINCTKAGNYPLWAMNKICNANKHRAIVVTTHFALVPVVSYSASSPDGSGGIVSEANSIGLIPGKRYASPIPANAEIEIFRDAKGTLQVSFGPSEEFAGQEVFSTLDDLCRLVFHCLERFQIAYVAAFR